MSLGAAGDPRTYEHRESPEEREMTVNGLRANEQPFTPKGDTVVGQAYSAIQKVHQEHRNYLDAVDRDDRFTDEARQDAIAGFKDTPAAKYLGDIEAAVDQRVTLAQTEYQRQLANLSQDGDTAQELRNSRTWERERRKLDAAESNPLALSLARQALEAADPATLSTLMQEIPSYLESRNIPTDWINPVVTQKVPELGEAQRRATLANQAKSVVDYDIAAIRTGIQKGYPPTQLVNPAKYDPDA